MSGLSPNHRSLAARRAKGWKRRYNLQTKARQERLNNCRKWKGDVTSRSSLEKCTTCRVVEHSDGALSEGLSAVVDAEVDCKDIFPAGETHESTITQVNEVTTDERSMDGCSCSATDSVSSRSSAVLGSVSDAIEVHDEGSSSEASNCALKCKRHSEKDLDNPKPSKYRKPTSDPYYLSCQYSRISFCGAQDCLPDGFYDAGRDRPFMPLPSYEKNTYVNSREVILLDR